MNAGDNGTAQLVGYPPEEILDCTVRDIVEDCEYISFYLPHQWSMGDGIGNQLPEDILTIYWTADVSGCDDRITYKTTVGKLLDDTFELHESCHESENAIEEDSVPLFKNIRDALQKEVDRINLWISNAIPTRGEK